MQAPQQDSRRKVAPLASVAPIIDAPERPLLPSGRYDTRTPDELRQVFMKTGTVHAASGSAYIEVGNTKVICAVYGPRQKRNMAFTATGKLTCDYKLAPFSTAKRGDYHQSAQEKELSELMVEALSVAVRLEKYPKSSIDVFAMVLQSDGGAFAAAVTAASLALADAGIEMLDLVSCSSAAVLNGAVILDPDQGEEEASSGSIALASMSSLSRVTQIVQAQPLPLPQSQEAIQLCVDACGNMYKLMRSALLAAAQKRIPSQPSHTSSTTATTAKMASEKKPAEKVQPTPMEITSTTTTTTTATTPAQQGPPKPVERKHASLRR